MPLFKGTRFGAGFKGTQKAQPPIFGATLRAERSAACPRPFRAGPWASAAARKPLASWASAGACRLGRSGPLGRASRHPRGQNGLDARSTPSPLLKKHERRRKPLEKAVQLRVKYDDAKLKAKRTNVRPRGNRKYWLTMAICLVCVVPPPKRAKEDPEAEITRGFYRLRNALNALMWRTSCIIWHLLQLKLHVTLFRNF